MATKCVSKSWADMEEEEEKTASTRSCLSTTKLSYASVVTGVVLANNVNTCTETESVSDSASDFSDFTVVSRKKKRNSNSKSEMAEKCENAVLQWAKNKGKVFKSECGECGDQVLCCGRCSSPFVYNANWKAKYEKLGWEAPKICKTCAQSRWEKRKI